MKEKKRTTTKIGVGSVVKEKVGEMEDNIWEVIIRSIRKEVVECVQDVVGKRHYEFNSNMVRRKI